MLFFIKYFIETLVATFTVFPEYLYFLIIRGSPKNVCVPPKFKHFSIRQSVPKVLLKYLNKSPIATAIGIWYFSGTAVDLSKTLKSEVQLL